MYQIHFTKSLFKSFQKLSSQTQKKILDAIEVVKQDPLIGKKLQGPLEGQRSYCVWPFRIIYQVKHKQLQIIMLSVGHRQGVYK